MDLREDQALRADHAGLTGTGDAARPQEVSCLPWPLESTT